jgi:hypothetical protein
VDPAERDETIQAYTAVGATRQNGGENRFPIAESAAAQVGSPGATDHLIIHGPGLIKNGATASGDGRRHLVDEKRSLALLKERARH